MTDFAPHRCIRFDSRKKRRYRFGLSDSCIKAVLRQMAVTRRGISEVACEAGIRRNVLARWLNGSGTIRLDQFMRVAAVLRIKVRVGD